MELREGSRVCSCVNGFYYGIPGTIVGRCQVQDLSRPGWDYNVELDNGRTVRLNENDIAIVSMEAEEAYNKRVKRDNEINEKAKARAKRIAENRRKNLEERETRREELDRHKQAETEAEAEELQQHYREEKGREYGLRSLGITDV